MCGPKNTAFGGANTPRPNFSNTPDFINETSGFEFAAPILNQPFNSFSAAPKPLNQAGSGGLRFPDKQVTNDIAPPPLPRPKPERIRPLSPELGKVYDFDEAPPPLEFNPKIRRDFIASQKKQVAREGQNPNVYAETNIDQDKTEKSLSLDDFSKSIARLQEKYGNTHSSDPEDSRLSLEHIKLQNSNAQKRLREGEQDRLELEAQNPGAYSEEGVSLDDLQATKLSGEEKRQQEDTRKQKVLQDKRLAKEDDDIANSLELAPDDEEIKYLKEKAGDNWDKIVQAEKEWAQGLGQDFRDTNQYPNTRTFIRVIGRLIEGGLNTAVGISEVLAKSTGTYDGPNIDAIRLDLLSPSSAKEDRIAEDLMVMGIELLPVLKGAQYSSKVKYLKDFPKVAKLVGGFIGALIVADDRDNFITDAFKDIPLFNPYVEKYREGKMKFPILVRKIEAAAVSNNPLVKLQFQFALILLKHSVEGADWKDFDMFQK